MISNAAQGRVAVRLLSVEKTQSLLREKLFEDSVKVITSEGRYAGVERKLRAMLVSAE